MGGQIQEGPEALAFARSEIGNYRTDLSRGVIGSDSHNRNMALAPESKGNCRRASAERDQ